MGLYVTGFFLVFAGMLIGYFLWYRDRSGDETHRRKLTRENEDLRTSLKLAHGSYGQLDERFTRQKGQLNVLQQLCDDWSTARENTERDRAQLEMEVADKTRRYEEALAELQNEKARRISLEDETHQLTQQQLEKLSLMEEDWRQKHSSIESSLIHHQADLKSTTSEKERLTAQLHDAESRVAELAADLASQKTLLETATKNASGLKQEYVSVETSLKESSELLKQARSECAAAQSAHKVAEECLADLQAEQAETKITIEELRAKVTNMESLESQVVSLQQSLENSTEQLEKVSKQRDEALEAEKSSLSVAAGLQQRIDNQETTIHGLRAKQQDSMNNLNLELQRRAELEADFESKSATLETRLAELQQELENQTGSLSNDLAQQRSELQNEISEKSATIAELTKVRDGLNQELTTTKNRLASLSDEQTKLESSVTSHLNSLTSLSSQFDGTKFELTQANNRIATLMADCDKFQSTTTEQSLTISQLTQERDETQQELAATQSRLTQLDTDLTNSNIANQERTLTIEELTFERDNLRVELESTKLQHEKLGAELENSNARASELTAKVEELRITCQRIAELETLIQHRDQEDQQVINELKAVREQYAASYAKQIELQEELDRVVVEHSVLNSETNRHDHQLQMMTMKLKASEETIRTLRRERAAVLARLANYRTIAEPEATVISFTEAMAQRQQSSVDFDREYGGPISRHAVRGLVYTEAPEKRDDLKLISGIAVVLEARLNDYGIYTFKQIMDWQPEAIEEFSRLLTFKDRIERDDWVGQAREFYERKRRSVAA
ncbi:MAG: hypothetical protein AB8B55_16165 [Mariniblastus sp.]